MPKEGLEPSRPLRTLDFESGVASPEVRTGVGLGRPGCEACTVACTDCWVDRENDLARVIGAWENLPQFVRAAILMLVRGFSNSD